VSVCTRRRALRPRPCAQLARALQRAEVHVRGSHALRQGEQRAAIELGRHRKQRGNSIREASEVQVL
jgi:hypothetical protein